MYKLICQHIRTICLKALKFEILPRFDYIEWNDNNRHCVLRGPLLRTYRVFELEMREMKVLEFHLKLKFKL